MLSDEDPQDLRDKRELRGLAMAALQDLGSIMFLPMGIAGNLLRQYQEQQARVAREELLAALARGGVENLLVVDPDDALSITARYLAAARDGAARRNIRLLAETIAGLAKEGRMTSDGFGRYAAVLAGLSRDQILVAGRWVAHFTERLGDQVTTPDDEAEAQDWDTRRGLAFATLVAELVPSRVPTEAELDAILGSLGGAGLMTVRSGFGILVYIPSLSLLELSRMVDLDGAAASER